MRKLRCAPGDNRAAINLGKETASSSTQMSPLVQSGENSAQLPTEECVLAPSSCPTGGLTTVTTQTLPRTGPHSTSNEVT